MKQLASLLLATIFLTQCNSTQISSIAPGTKITKLAIVKNPNLHMDGMQPEVVKQVEQLGIVTELVDAAPAGNGYYLTFTANWSWDLAMYLRYFKAELHQGPTVVAKAEYKTSGSDLNKFGHTDDKIRPILKELLTGEKTVPVKKKPKSELHR